MILLNVYSISYGRISQNHCPIYSLPLGSRFVQNKKGKRELFCYQRGRRDQEIQSFAGRRLLRTAKKLLSKQDPGILGQNVL